MGNRPIARPVHTQDNATHKNIADIHRFSCLERGLTPLFHCSSDLIPPVHCDENFTVVIIS
jgi:hypothetical protein